MKFLLLVVLIPAGIHSNAQPGRKKISMILDTVYQQDQSLRVSLDSLNKKYGWQSEQVQSLVKITMVSDSINLVKVKGILDRYGWLGPEQVGKRGAQAIFLVIQHADSLTQVTYFPLMQKAVRKGKARKQDLALLEDRILTNQGKEQVYGSQVRTNASGKFEFFPIKDEANVNKRRAAVGLQPLEEYAKYFDIVYVLPAPDK